VRRTLLVLALVAALTVGLTACGNDGDERGEAPPTSATNPLDAKAEVRDPNADFGWDRTESDPQVLAELLAVAQRLAETPVDCIDAGETSIEAVKITFDIARLPVPAATVQCTTFDEEDLTFEGFLDEQAKLTFIEAKQELLCERGKRASTDPATGKSAWTGIPYVDGGTFIIEPTVNETRDAVAQALGLPAFNFCTNADKDPAPPPDLG
jgi:predicted small lipoprotein YifL